MSPSHDGYVGPKALSKRTVRLGMSWGWDGSERGFLGMLLHIPIYIYIYVCIHVCILYIYICVCVYMYMYMYIHMCKYIDRILYCWVLIDL